MKILALIPAYNEEETIENVIRDLKKKNPDIDYLVINDGSVDRTEEILSGMGASYITLPFNLGIGGGIQTGYRYALEGGYDIAIQVDGDGQHDTFYIPAMVELIEKGEADIVIGSRFIEGEGFQSSGMRRLGISFLSRLIKLCCGVKVLDVTSGFRAVDRKYFEMFAGDYPVDYPEPESLITASLRGAKIREVPVKMRERQGGVSSISFFQSIYYMTKVSFSIILRRLWTERKNNVE